MRTSGIGAAGANAGGNIAAPNGTTQNSTAQNSPTQNSTAQLSATEYRAANRALGRRTAVITVAALAVAVGGLSASAAQGSASTSATPAAQAGEVVTKAKKPRAVLVQAEAEAGAAATGNALPADILVVVTDPVTGLPSVSLTQANFVVINHFSHPGQACGFSNNIVSFGNVGTGAYHLQVAPMGCTWATGDFLLQVMVTSGHLRGQAVAKFEVH